MKTMYTLAVAGLVGLATSLSAQATLVAYYPFEDAGPGTFLDDHSGLGNDLSSGGGGPGADTVNQFLGTSAAVFNGSTWHASINMADFTELQNAGVGFTLTGWFRNDLNDAADRDIFYAGDSASLTDVMFQIDTRASLDRARPFVSDDGTTLDEIDDAAASGETQNVWTFFAFVWNNGTATAYAGLATDANLNVGTPTSPGYTTLNTANGVFRIGRATDATAFDGLIDEVTVWNEVLNDAQVERMFDEGKLGVAANLITVPEPSTALLAGSALLLLRRFRGGKMG